MFCHLFVLSERTKNSFHEKEKCFKECTHYKEGTCLITTIKKQNLTNEKFGWVMEELVEFNPIIESKSGSTRTVCALNLIHPSDPDIWIIYNKRLDKNNGVWDMSFRLFQSGEFKEFDNLAALNSYLIKRSYDGRKIMLSDFNIHFEENNVSNPKVV